MRDDYNTSWRCMMPSELEFSMLERLGELEKAVASLRRQVAALKKASKAQAKAKEGKADE